MSETETNEKAEQKPARTGRRIAIGIIVFCLLLLAALIGATYGVLNTERGTQWSLQLTQRLLPALRVDAVRGNWLSGLHAGGVSWLESGTEIHIRDLDLQLQWSPLLRGEIRLLPLRARELRLVLKGESSDEPTKLPLLFLPLTLNIPALSLQHFAIVDGNAGAAEMFALDDIRAGARWRATTLRLEAAHLRWQEHELDVGGELWFRGDYPLRLQGQLRSPQLPDVVTIKTDGDLRALQLQADIAQPYALHGVATLRTLDKQLPLQVQLELMRPLVYSVADSDVTLGKATLKAHGDLTRIEGTLAAAIATPQYGDSQLDATVQWQPEQAQAALQWRSTGGAIKLDCTATLDRQPAGHCAGAIAELALTPWLGGQTGALSSAITLDGRWLDPQWQLAVALPDLRGQLGAETLRGRLDLRTDDGEQWQLRELALNIGPNQVEASGDFGTRNKLQMTVAARDLSRLHPEFGGSVSGSAALNGPWPDPTLRGQLRGDNLRANDIRAAHAAIDFALPKLGREDGRVRLDLQGLASGAVADVDLTLSLSGTRAQQRLALNLQQRSNRAALQCASRSADEMRDWQVDCADFHGVLRVGKNSGDWHNVAPLRAQFQTATNRFELKPFCLRIDSGELCLDQPLRYTDAKLQPFAAHGRELPLRWASAWLPDNVRLANDARIGLQLQLASIAPLRATANAQIPQTKWRWYTLAEPQTAEVDDIKVSAVLDEKRAQFSASAQSPTIGAVSSQLSVTDPRGQRILDGRVDIEKLELAGLAWLVEGLDALSGQINGGIRITGTVAAPLLHGQLLLQNGSATWAPLGSPFRDIHADLTFDNTSAKLGGWFALGQGGGDIDGDIHWEGSGDNWALRLGLVAGGVSAMPLQDSTVVFSPHATLTAKPGEMHVDGYVDVASADISLKQLPPDTVDVSQDTEIVGQADDDDWNIWVKLGLNLGDQFHFRGFGADVNLSGRLQLAMAPGDVLHMTGEVKVPRGRYRAYGQRLSVRKGSLIFYGPLDNPDLNLEAVRDMPPGVTDVVGLRVIGSLKTPEAVLFSEPSMTDSDIAYYLLTGRKPVSGTNTATSGYSASGALLSLGMAGSEDTAGKLASKFGISDLQLGTSEGSNGTEAEVSGQLGDNLYVRYGRSLGQRSNSISFQYRLTPKLMIETISGMEDALDLLYSFEIK